MGEVSDELWDLLRSRLKLTGPKIVHLSTPISTTHDWLKRRFIMADDPKTEELEQEVHAEDEPDEESDEDDDDEDGDDDESDDTPDE